MADEPIVKVTGSQPPKPPALGDLGGQIKRSSSFTRWQEQYEGKRLAPQYDFPRVVTGRDYFPQTQPTRRGETAQQMPYYSQLTPLERSLYEWLPGFSQSSVGQALQKFGESPFGKALSYLDIPAEGLERIGGVASQFWKARDNPLEMQDLRRDLTAAWYAGSLGADMWNLPTFDYDEIGNVRGMAIPTDLPGAAGLAKARKDIVDLVGQGATYSEALQEVKSNYYDNIGALQLRAQLYDTYTHVLFDPLNFIMPAIKPIERVRVASELASTTRWADDVIDAAREASRLLAEGDLNKFDEVADWARTAGLQGERLAELERVVEVKDAAKLSSIMDNALKDVGLRTRDKIALYVTGKQDPLRAPTKLDKYLPWRLTPDSRGYELMTTVQDNVGSYIIARTDDPYEIANDISRAASGAVGPELGHAFVTREGRAVQGLLQGFDTESQKLIGAYDLIADERRALTQLAEALGTEEEKIVGMLANGDFASVSRMSEGLFSPDDLETLFNAVDKMPYTNRIFKLQMMNKLADHTARQAILMYGIESRGFFLKLANAMKAAETLAFLRINPGFMIRNVLNNETTMIARGLGVNMGDIEDIVKNVISFEPQRLGQGYGAIGESLGQPLDTGSKLFADALTGERGTLDKFSDYLNNLKIPGGLDMGSISARAERHASRRAFTAGYLQGWNRYFWKPGRGFDAPTKYFPAQIQDQLNTIDRGLIPAVENAVASAKNPQQLEDAFRGNLNISLKSIMDDASERLGYKVDDALPDEFVAKIENGLNDAAQKGTVREYMSTVRQELQDHLDEISKDSVKRMKEFTAAKLRAEGPAAFPKIWADQMREWHGAAIQHIVDTQTVTDAIRLQKQGEIIDWDLISSMWRTFEKQSDQFYSRYWDRFDGTVQGMVKGAKAEGMKLSDDVIPMFKDIKRGWRDWWKNKRKMMNQFYDARNQGKTPPMGWDEMQDVFNSSYDEMVELELRMKGEIDQLVAQSLDDPELQQRFLDWQGVSNRLNEQDKRAVEDLFERVRGMNAQQRADTMDEFQRLRIKRYENMVNVDNAGEASMMGDADSVKKIVAATPPDVPQGKLAPFGETFAEEVQAILDGEREFGFYGGLGFGQVPDELPEGLAIERNVASYGGNQVDIVYRAERSKEELFQDFDHFAEEFKRIEQIDDPIKEGEELGKLFGYSDEDIKAWRDNYIRVQAEEELQAAEELGGLPQIEINEGLPPKPVVPPVEEVAPSVERLSEVPNLGGVYGRKYLLDHGFTDTQIDDLLAEGVLIEGEYAGKATIRPSDETLKAIRDFRKPVEQVEKQYIPYSIEKQAQPPFPQAIVEDTFWFTRGNQALEGIERSAIEQAAKPPLKWDKLPKEAQQYMENYLKHVQGQMGDARYASTRFAEFRRDAALLNYNRRYNFDTFATMIFPYQFWFTHSAAMWMLHTVDRPAMLSSFLRIKEFMNTAGAPNQALPSRLKGTMRVPIPFLPDWMGDSIFFDPLRALVPFDTFAYPFEQYMQRNQTIEGRTEYILNDMLENGQLTQEEFDSAVDNPDDPYWMKAREMAIADDEELKFSVWDFANLISAPHAPLNWAYETARGTPENIGPFTPASRTIKGVAGLLGVDWDRSPYNLEARVRTSLGLPAFDKWDDYRIDRMLSNMAAMGEITVEEAHRAMIDREGDAYNEAIKKANKEFGISALGSTLGIPAKSYPEGEFLQRSLKDDFSRAYEGYESAIDKYFVEHPEYRSVEKHLRAMIDRGGKEETIEEIYNANKNVFLNSDLGQDNILQILREISNSSQSLNNFFRLHPEYENRLALFKPPEERLKNFLIDDIWNIYNDLPGLTKSELKEQLGEEFEEKFVNKWTRSYDAISLDEMQVWLKLMGGDPPGTLNSEPQPIDLTDPEIAWRVQVFYDTRQQFFGNEIFDIQGAYYDIPEDNKKARKAYRNQHPELIAYWEWRKDWLHRNPETVPYLTEKPYEFKYSSPQAEQRAQQPEPWMTWDEWRQHMGPSMTNLMEDHFLRDYEIPGPLQNRIDELAEQLGLGYSEALGLMEESLALR